MKIRNYIFDCDGVLWNGEDAIPGAVEAISYLLYDSVIIKFTLFVSLLIIVSSPIQFILYPTTANIHALTFSKRFCAIAMAPLVGVRVF